jgi:hypothetical protein
MKRLFPTGLALFLVVGSLGHVFAATFCPRGLGHACCFAKNPSQAHNSASKHEDIAAGDMPMHDMAMNGIPMDAGEANHKSMDGSTMDCIRMNHSIAVDKSASSPAAMFEATVTNKFDQPTEPCPHCLSHSGMPNAPVSFVNVPDQSGKEAGFVPLPVSRFLVRPAMSLSQSGLPREHAPPGMSAPRHILISVFLI